MSVFEKVSARQRERQREREKEGERREKGEVMSVLLRQVVAVNCSPVRPVKPIKILGKPFFFFRKLFRRVSFINTGPKVFFLVFKRIQSPSFLLS